MNRGWLWLAAGAGGAAVWFGRRRALGSPLGGVALPAITAHGDFGAHRAGPPEHTHHGLDIAAAPSSRVVAVADGVIIHAEPGLGHIVRKLRLDRPAAWSPAGERIEAVVYADLGTPLVEPGERVRKGQAVATVSSHGFFHFAVKAHGDQFIDPATAGFRWRAPGQEAASWLV
jgi:murein DD-endopeptidase MepM/ murein hydrolase activator NlpD